MSTRVHEHLRALLEATPETGQVTVPRRWIEELLGAAPAPTPIAVPAPLPRPAVGDRLLTVAQAASRLGLSPATVYRRASADDTWAPFVRRIGARTLRFEAAGLERYLAARRPTAA